MIMNAIPSNAHQMLLAGDIRVLLHDGPARRHRTSDGLVGAQCDGSFLPLQNGSSMGPTSGFEPWCDGSSGSAMATRVARRAVGVSGCD